MRKLLALLLLLTSSPAAAKTTDLLCSDEAQPPHQWNVTLNEENGTGTVMVTSTGHANANVPAVFTPDEVRVKTGADTVFIVNRTTLAFHYDAMGIANRSGRCEIVTNPERKF